jgi:hypothetical protein
VILQIIVSPYVCQWLILPVLSLCLFVVFVNFESCGSYEYEQKMVIIMAVEGIFELVFHCSFLLMEFPSRQQYHLKHIIILSSLIS